MKIAIPVTNGQLSQHFGHCEEFILFDVDSENKVVAEQKLQSPEHEPGKLPGWLGELGADTIIAGGMGGRAQDLFSQNGIRVVTGVESRTPDSIIAGFLDGTLETGVNTCDH